MSNTKAAMLAILFKQESYQLIGACFEVYNQMGHGFLEPVYQECLELEFGLQKVSFAAQPKLKLEYKDNELEAICKPDFVCYEKIIIEIKAISEFHDVHRAQVHNYLKATGYRLGLLVNFGSASKLKYERIVK
ncbi:GxxExxY protein [Adhaeretor mobilis]|uniref:GxxExxY protein n=1 Tax=Adhaeretor mobilis TaxID=1930276 RepID=A0A517MVP3_9BACT|nr:GxxExxY protein [Adhaeretor mobilis]QDS98954.1 hypothetical protein HG15A2_22420 [Adhaeretor mobilis]